MAQQKQAEAPKTRAKRSEYTVPADKNVTYQKAGDFIAQKMFEYGRFTIEDRAIPDFRDGHIPAQRRLLYSLHDLQPSPGGAFLKVARVTGDCFVKGTLVDTPSGVVAIEDLRKGDLVRTPAGARTVTELYELPKQRLVEVQTASGTTNTSTRDQKFKVLDWAQRALVWKSAQHLKVGDILLQSKHSAEAPEPSSFGYLSGYYIGNGSFDVKARRLSLACPTFELAQHIQVVIKNVLGLDAHIHEKQYQGRLSCLEVRCSGTAAQDFVASLGLLSRHAHTKFIRWSAFKNLSDLAGLVSGLFDSDGTYRCARSGSDVRREVTYVTVSTQLARDVQHLLSVFGLSSSVFNNNAYGKHAHTAVNVTGAEARAFCSLFKSFSTKKAERAATIRTTPDTAKSSLGRDVVGLYAAVRESITKAHVGGGWYNSPSGKVRIGAKYKNGVKVQMQLKDKLSFEALERMGLTRILEVVDQDLLRFINDLRGLPLHTDVVVAVAAAKSDVTYDIQVDDQHQFFANRILVSNCMGRFHPHSSAVGPLVNLTYDRYPLIKGQGNYGSIKGDKNAAERYIECRVTKLIKDHFACAAVMETVPNYSDEFQEPLIINTRLPLLLMNGAVGTALGYVTNIPAHNVTEICQALEYLARNWKTATTAGLLEFIKGPDCAFGGVLLSSKDDLLSVYETGVGSVRFSCDYKIEPHEKLPNVTNIVVHGFPDAFNVKSFVTKLVPQMKAARTIVGYSEFYNKKTQELRLVLSVDNSAALKKVTAALQCSSTYRFSVTERRSDDETDTEFMENLPLLSIMRKWLLWRKAEEEKMMRLELEKLAASKFLEDCKLLAMLNIKVLAAAIDQDKEDASAYLLRVMKNVTAEQIETMLGFRLKDLKRLDEGALRKKIQGIIAEIASVNRDLQRPMAVVVKHLQQIAAEHGDARRTRASGKLHDERKMQQTGDPVMFGVTVDGKLLGTVDEKGSNASLVLASPSFEGIAAFGAAGVVDFFGASSTGKAGVGLEKIVGVASREAPFLFALGVNGCYNKIEQDRDSNKPIPVFLKDTQLLFGGGCWDTDKLILWDAKENSKTIPMSELKCMRKNVKGVKIPFKAVSAVLVREGQVLLTSDGRQLSTRNASNLGDAQLFACGARNLVIYKSGRRKFLTLVQLQAELNRGDIIAVHDATLPKAVA